MQCLRRKLELDIESCDGYEGQLYCNCLKRKHQNCLHWLVYYKIQVGECVQGKGRLWLDGILLLLLSLLFCICMDSVRQCGCVHMSRLVCTCGDQRSALGVDLMALHFIFWNSFSLNLGDRLSLNLELINLAKLTGPWATWSACLYPPPPPRGDRQLYWSELLHRRWWFELRCGRFFTTWVIFSAPCHYFHV